MLISIDQVLTKDEVRQFRQELDASDWNDGAATAGTLAKSVKRNQQVADGSALAVRLGQHILRRHMASADDDAGTAELGAVGVRERQRLREGVCDWTRRRADSLGKECPPIGLRHAQGVGQPVAQCAQIGVPRCGGVRSGRQLRW